MAQQQTAAAIETYRKVVTLVPGNTTVVHQLVALQMGAKNWDGARHSLHEALLVRPGDADLLRTLVGVTLAELGEDSALSEIWKLQADPVNRIGARTLVADLDMFTHHFKQAAGGYVALLQTTRSQALALQAAQAYRAAGEADLARKLLEDWLADQPDDVEVASALAVLDISNDHLDDARKLLEGVLKHQPSNVVALNNLAWIYGQQHDPRALDTARRSFAIVPEPHSADTLGWILLARGDVKTALPLLTQAANAMKDNSGAQYHYAAALKANGKLKQAADVLRPIVDQAKPFSEQAAARQMLEALQPAK
jgi:tetratricopeptide (TPR) repeat protein